MMDFNQTIMGKRFYESTMPRIASALENLEKKMDIYDAYEIFKATKELCSDGHSPSFEDVIEKIKSELLSPTGRE